MSSQNTTTNQGGRDKLETIGRLHRAGVHLVRCREKDEGDKKAKSAIDPGWQKRPASLAGIVKHVERGGLAGFVPGRSGLWGADVDHFPGDERSAHALLQNLNIEPLSVIHTQRGLHLLFRRVENETEIKNLKWELSGYSGEFRGDNGYLVLWQPEKVLHALTALALAKPVSTTLFPPPSKNGATPTAKGFVKGNRTDHLNAIVFAARLAGQTDFTAERAAAIESGLPVEKVDTIIKKAVADADAKKAAAFPRKDATALEGALAQLGITIRYNIRAMQPELSNGGGTWEKTTDRSSADLRRVIANKFSYQLADDKGTAPLRYGLDSWAEHLNALLHHLEVDPFIAWLESLPAWDGAARLARLLPVCLGATEGPLTSWASIYLALGAVQRAYEPGGLLREIPILIGPQRIGKSQLLSNLLPPEHPDWFSDSVVVSDPTQKRVEGLLGRVIVELSELTGFRRAELDSLKSFISRRDDGATRLAYRRDPETALRRCILVGTSNPEECLPNDPSGNTRFVPVECSKGTHVEPFMDKWRSQLWAEGLALYRAGERADLPRDLMPLQEQHGERHRRKDSMVEDAVAEIVGNGPFTIRELFNKCCPGGSISDRRAESRLADALHSAGWAKRHERVDDGKRAYLWRRHD